MRSMVGVAILMLGAIGACLFVGLGSSSDCAAGMGSAACLGGSVGSIGNWFGIASAASAFVVGFLVVSLSWQAGRHQRLARLLAETARFDHLGDHHVGLVAGLAAPYVAGLIRPKIYCPSDLADHLSEPELRAVLLHEGHHQLAHAPARLVVLAALTPVLGRLEAGRGWTEVQRAAIEIAADDHALQTGARRPDLARALLKLGATSVDARLPSYVSASELRLRHLAGEPSPANSRLRVLAPLLLPLTAFVVCLVWGPMA